MGDTGKSRAVATRISRSLFLVLQDVRGGWFLPILCLWILSMILTPIGLWIWGSPIFPILTTVTVVFQTLASLIGLSEVRSIRWIITRIALIILATTALEVIGSTTGFPFGRYHYTDLLQPQFAGVPLLIPMAWTMMLVPAWAIASAVLGRVKIKHFQFLIFAFVSALAFTTWDFYLDPHMVARGLWIWEQPSGFFGIPWSNYLGWVLGASFITLLANPGELRSTKLVVIYSTTWVFQAIAQLVFWSQPGPAIVGFLTMGIFVFMSWRSIWEHLKSCSGS